MTFNTLSKKTLSRMVLILALLMVVSFLPSVSAEWYNPFTWNDNTYERGEGWFLDYNSGIQKDNFNVEIQDLGNGKAKVCLIPKTDLRINNEIIKQSRAVVRKNNIITREVEPSDMELESEGGNIKKMCVDVDKINEDYIKFGEHSTVIKYTSEDILIKDSSGDDLLQTQLTTEDFYYKNDKPHKDLGLGYQLTHTIKLTAKQDVENVLNNIVLINEKTGQEITKDYDVKIRYSELIEIPTYDNSCDNNESYLCQANVNGSYLTTTFKWMDTSMLNYTIDMVQDEEIVIGIFMFTNEGEYIDIIPTVTGIEFDFWASWSASLDNGILAYYDLQNSSVVDLTGITGDGTSIGSVTWGNAGILGGGYTGTGSVGRAAINNLTTGNTFSFSFWVNTNTSSDGFYMDSCASTCTAATRGNFLQTGTTFRIAFGATTYSGITEASMNDGSWHHIVIIKDGTTYGSYLDGVSIQNDSSAPTFNFQYATAIGGNRVDGSTAMTGMIDEWGVWTRSLTLTEIGDLYGDGSPPTYGEIPADSPPTVTLGTPSNSAYRVESLNLSFTCKGIDDFKLDNLTYYLYYSNGSVAYSEVNTDGQNDTFETFNTTVYAANNYSWNCLAIDNSSQSSFATSNNSIIMLPLDSVAKNISTGLISYYPFDDLTGDLTDVFAGNTLTENSTVPSAVGLIENSRGPYSVENYFVSSDAGFGYATNKSFTHNFWINRTDDTAIEERIVSSGVNCGEVYYNIRLETDNTLRSFFGTTCVNDTSINGVDVVPLNEWTMITFIHESNGTSRYYFNGVYKGSALYPTLNIETMDLAVGASPAGTVPVGNSTLDEFGIWNHSLSQDEITLLYSGGYGLPFGTYDSPPVVNLHYPTDSLDIPQTTIDFNCTVYDALQLDNVSLYIDGTLNETNSSGLNNTVYSWTKTLSKGSHNWTCSGTDNSSQITTAPTRTFRVYTPITFNPNLRNGLIAWYDLENSSAVDRTGITGNGTANGNADFIAAGVVGNGYEGDGADSNVQVNNITTTGNTLSISTWFNTTNPDLDATHYYIFDSYNGSGGSQRFNVVFANGGIHTDINGPDYQYTADASDLIDGQWHNLFAIQNGTNLYLYLDGVSVLNSTGITPTTIATTSAIGSNRIGSTNDVFLGMIDEVAIWDIAIDRNLVNEYYNNGFPPEFLSQNAPNVSIGQGSLANGIKLIVSPILVNFNCSNIYDNLYTVDNVSLVVNSAIVNTSFTPANGSNVVFSNTYTDGSYSWYCEATNNESYTGYTDTRTFSIDSASPVVTITAPSNGTLITEPNQSFNLNWTALDANLDTCWYGDGTTNNTITCSLNTTTLNYPISNPDLVTYTFYANDTFGNIGSDSVTLVKSTSSPIITLYSPTTLYDTLAGGDSIDLNFSITNTSILDTCWYSYNGTNNTVSCTANDTFTYQNNVNTLTFYSNDTLGNMGSSTVSWIILALTDQVIYEAEVIETDTTQFKAVLTLTENVTGVTGNLIYDGNIYSATPTLGTNKTNLTVNIDVPIYDTITNVSFYFSMNVTTLSGSGTANSPTYNQIVNPLFIVQCSAGNQSQIANYTTRVARTPFDLLNTTMASSWYYHLNNGTGSVAKNTSFQDVTETKSAYYFCLNVNETIKVSNQFEATATGYTTSSNYLIEALLKPLTNTTSNTIYLLNNSLADATVLQVYDQSGFPIGDVLINVQYYDIGTNSYITVKQALTSSIGSDVVYLNWLDSFYKFVVVKDGETVETTLPEKIFESPRIFTIGTDPTFTFSEFQGIDYNIYYNNATQNFVLTFAKPTGAFVEGCLRVEKRTSNADTLICDECTEAASATLLCNIGAEGNGTYIATFYGVGSLAGIDWIIEIIGDNFSQIIADALSTEDQTFYAFLLGLLVTGITFVNPVGGIIGILISIFIGNLLGFVLIDFLTFAGITITGVIIAWLIKG